MTNPTPTDCPIPAGVIAGIDETVVQRDGVDITCVLAGVVFREAQAARRAFQQLIAHRKRRFHWREEGPERREEAVTLLETGHVDATYLFARTTGIHRPLEARRELLAHLVAELLNDRVDHVIIESSGVQANDGRDRDTILDSFRADSANRTFTHDWCDKTEPLLWYPDALAGVAHQFLADGQTHHFQRLQAVSDNRHYVKLGSGRFPR